jgi:hypothetical protein
MMRAMLSFTRHCVAKRLATLILLPLLLLSCLGGGISRCEARRSDQEGHNRNKRHGGFTWSANVDRSTGLASSFESTWIAPKSRLYHKLDQEGGSVSDVVASLFADYPLYLGKPSLFFGLARCIKTPHKYEIRLRPFNINFISFGHPSLHSDRMHDYKDGTVSTVTTVSFPVIDGLLVLNRRKDYPQAGSCGRLDFSVRQRHVKVMTSYALGSAFLESQIVDYKPAILGHPPVPFVRRCLYRGTQSLLHAYVTWRYHMYCISKKWN